MSIIQYIISVVSAIIMFFNSLSALGGGAVPATTTSGTYPKTAVVTGLNYATDTVTFTDANGYTWQMHGCEDWAIGDTAAMIMDDNGTPFISDDRIVSCYYQHH